MDILRKMFSKPKDEKEQGGVSTEKDEFRKPTWYEETETDDELFDGDRKFLFQIFTNPIELQKHFDRQMQQFMKSMNQLEGVESFEPPTKEDYLKPGFEDKFIEEFKKKSLVDTDLDGEIYADQLHSLLQRVSPDVQEAVRRKKENNLLKFEPKKKLSDEEIIMGKIHGTIVDEDSKSVIRRKDVQVPRMAPHFGGVFEGTYQGPKLFGQSIVNQTIRKPDGSYETKLIVRDSDGNVKTTTTRTINGQSETVTTYGNGKGDGSGGGGGDDRFKSNDKPLSVGNIFVTKSGYALPMNLW